MVKSSARDGLQVLGSLMMMQVHSDCLWEPAEQVRSFFFFWGGQFWSIVLRHIACCLLGMQLPCLLPLRRDSHQKLLVESSFLLLVVRPGAPSSILVPSSDARSP